MDPDVEDISYGAYRDWSYWGFIQGQFGYDQTDTVVVSIGQEFENPNVGAFKASYAKAASIL